MGHVSEEGGGGGMVSELLHCVPGAAAPYRLEVEIVCCASGSGEVCSCQLRPQDRAV